MGECEHDAIHQRFRKEPNLITSVPGFKIALVQMKVVDNKQDNLDQVAKEVGKLKEKGAQLVILPESFNAPYGLKYYNQYAEEIPKGETSKVLSHLAKKYRMCIVGGTIAERSGDQFFCTCTVWGDSGELLTSYRKTHLFSINIPNKVFFKESDTITAGNKIAFFDFDGIRIGLGVSYDLRFAELGHLLAREGCHLLIYPCAFNITTGPLHWELLARARAVDLQLWVVLVSPARDTQAFYVAWGHSIIVNPWGEVIGQLDEKPGVILTDIDLNSVDEVRTQVPILHQKRTDMYKLVKQ